jgi:hypothetical protein
MSPVILALLSWLQWTPKDTRSVVGLRRSIADRVESSLDAVTPHTPSNLLPEILEEARSALREGLSERQVADGIYCLELGADPSVTARVLRSRDGCSWTLREFDDFIDLGLYPKGSTNDAG